METAHVDLLYCTLANRTEHYPVWSLRESVIHDMMDVFSDISFNANFFEDDPHCAAATINPYQSIIHFQIWPVCKMQASLPSTFITCDVAATAK